MGSIFFSYYQTEEFITRLKLLKNISPFIDFARNLMLYKMVSYGFFINLIV